MSQQVKTWIKYISGMEQVDNTDVERHVVRQENQNDLTCDS